MSSYDAVIWIDDREAQIFEFRRHAVTRQVVPNPQTEGTGPDFFAATTEASAPARKILIAGPGTPKGELMLYLRAHAPDLAQKVLAVETLEHPADNLIVAFAHAFLAQTGEKNAAARQPAHRNDPLKWMCAADLDQIDDRRSMFHSGATKGSRR